MRAPAIIARVPATANAAARQSGSFHPPKSRAVATKPRMVAAGNAMTGSSHQPSGRAGRINRAIRLASPPAAIQSAIPIELRVPRISHRPCAASRRGP